MNSDHFYVVYIMASKRNGTLYTGFSGYFVRRVAQHKLDLIGGFTKKYGVHRLVWYEVHADVHAAIAREKQIKGWNRVWKIRLIEKMNPSWSDLYTDLLVAEGYELGPFDHPDESLRSLYRNLAKPLRSPSLDALRAPRRG